MAIKVRVLRELRKELRELERVRDSAVARIHALEILIGRRPPEIGSLPQPARAGRGESLRSEVVKSLQLKSSSALALARHLEADGFRVGGSTTLRERVAHELSRLRRKGVVRRTSTGEYELCERLNGAPTSPPAVAARREESLPS